MHTYICMLWERFVSHEDTVAIIRAPAASHYIPTYYLQLQGPTSLPLLHEPSQPHLLTVRHGANTNRTVQNNLLYKHMYVQCQQTATILAMGTIHAYNTSVYSPPTMINMSICGSGVPVCGSGGPVGEGGLVVG